MIGDKKMEKNNSSKKKLISNLDGWTASGFMIVLVIMTFMGALFRYIVKSPITWLEEVQKICLVWIVFLTSGYVFRHGSHIAVEILVDALPPTGQKVCRWIIRIVVISVLTFLTIQCFRYVAFFMNSEKVTPVLRIPYWIDYLVAPIGCLDMIVSFISNEIATANGKEADR